MLFTCLVRHHYDGQLVKVSAAERVIGRPIISVRIKE